MCPGLHGKMGGASRGLPDPHWASSPHLLVQSGMWLCTQLPPCVRLRDRLHEGRAPEAVLKGPRFVILKIIGGGVFPSPPTLKVAFLCAQLLPVHILMHTIFLHQKNHNAQRQFCILLSFTHIAMLLLGFLNYGFKWLHNTAGVDIPPVSSAIFLLLNIKLFPVFTANVAVSIFIQTAFPPPTPNELFP